MNDALWTFYIYISYQLQGGGILPHFMIHTYVTQWIIDKFSLARYKSSCCSTLVTTTFTKPYRLFFMSKIGYKQFHKTLQTFFLVYN